jgi:hypothetical protein
MASVMRHYDVLFGLKVLAESGYLDNSRCGDALDLLARKRLPDGGFPALDKVSAGCGGSKP